MEEIIVWGDSLAEAYHEALHQLELMGEISLCPDWHCLQKEISMTMVVVDPLSSPMISNLFIGGPADLEQYTQEMLDGILDFEVERGNWDYTYHDRMVNFPKGYMIDWDCRNKYEYGVNQLAFVVEELRRNPFSRRAVITIRSAKDITVDAEPACLQHIQFFIREGKLHCKVLFRSNDACKATFMNAYALIQLQKRIADELEVAVGTYTHRANSFHCYEKDFDLFYAYVKRIRYGKEDAYADGELWAELMEEAKPEIAKKVKELMER